MNELDASTLGYSSVKSAIGKKFFDHISSEDATLICNNNRWVEQTNKMLITEESIERKDFNNRCLSIKQPLYANNKIIGIMGCSIYFTRDSLSQSLNQIVNMGLLNPVSANNINNVVCSCPYDLSKREKNLYYCVKENQRVKLVVYLSCHDEP